MGFQSRHQDERSPRGELAELLARDYRLDLARAREILHLAEQASYEDPQARSIQQWFSLLVEENAHGPDALGKRTQLDPDHEHGAVKPVPGRVTLVTHEVWRQTEQAEEAVPRNAPRLPPQPRKTAKPERIGPGLQWRMDRAFDYDFSGVRVWRDSPLATGNTRALARGGELHFREGAYQPDTPEGDRLIAHELTHVVQQSGRGERAGSRRELEHEADRAAARIVAGHAARVELNAQSSMAYAFDDSEVHDDGIDQKDGESIAPAAEFEGDQVRQFTEAALARDPRESRRKLSILYATEGASAVRAAVLALDPDPRIRVGVLLGIDLSFVDFERGPEADQFLDEISADGAAVGATVYLRAGLDPERAWELETHELTHVAQTGGGGSSRGEELDVASPESAVEVEAEEVGQRLAAYQPMDRPLVQSAPMGTVLRGKGKIIGWLVKVGERKLIKTTAIYSEKELTKLLAKGFNVLVRDGKQTAKRIAKKVWGDGTLHHTGHIVKKTGKLGRSHFQPLRHGVGRAGEKGWHIFYSAMPILFFSDDVEALAIYEDKCPGKSIANYLTVTQYVGEDSWWSLLDWANPLELVAVAGDIGRDLDRERLKELKSLLFTREGPNGTIQTYELDPEGKLVKVHVKGPKGEQKEFTAQEFYRLIEHAVSGVAVEQDPPSTDGTTNPNYASTYDAEFRIYHSRKGWSYDGKTLSYFLPATHAAKLVRTGSFYVNRVARTGYFYVIVHPSLRATLGQPGFRMPPDRATDYDAAQDKEQFLLDVLASVVTAKVMDNIDPFQVK